MTGADANVSPTHRTSRLRRRSTKIALDTGLLVAFVAEFLSREGPDYSFHSWVGIFLIPVIAIHLAGNAGWIVRVWNRKRADREFGLGLLNAAFGLTTGVCIATGFPIWLEWSDAEVWAALHTVTGMAAIGLTFVHLWRNRSRIARLVRPPR